MASVKNNIELGSDRGGYLADMPELSSSESTAFFLVEVMSPCSPLYSPFSLGMTFLQSVASTKFLNVFSSGVATLVFLSHCLVNLRVGIILGISMFVGALLGGRIALFLDTIWLAASFYRGGARLSGKDAALRALI